MRFTPVAYRQARYICAVQAAINLRQTRPSPRTYFSMGMGDTDEEREAYLLHALETR